LHCHGEVGEATSVTDAPVDSALGTLPYRWYTDPRVAEIERDRMFRRTWQYAGHAGELDGPGLIATFRAYVRARIEPELEAGL
jgi:hypothetical protein